MYMKVHVHSTLAKRKVIYTNTYLPFPNPYLAFHTNKHGQIDIQTNMDKHLDAHALRTYSSSTTYVLFYCSNKNVHCRLDNN